MKQRLATVKQAAEYMGRTPKAITRMYQKGILTPIRIDTRVQIDLNQIDALIERSKVNPF